MGSIMFDKMKLTEWNFEEQGTSIGIVKANLPIFRTKTFADLLTRDQSVYFIEEIGRVNYAYLDQFIVKAFNDYYQKMNQGTKEEIAKKVGEYQRLYQMWNFITQAKANHLPTLNNLYDDLIYELYMLGYKE